MRVTVRKCPFTGKIFEESKLSQYKVHLAAVRDTRRKERLHVRIRTEFDGWLTAEKKLITDVKEIPEWILKNQEYLMEVVNSRTTIQRDKFVAGDKYTKLDMTVQWRDSVSNTHSCPKNGSTNWGNRDKSLPTGYPGWLGHISGSLSRPKKNMFDYPCAEVLNLVGLYTGSGGGGNVSWNYGVSIFISDWPGIEEKRVFDTIAGKL